MKTLNKIYTLSLLFLIACSCFFCQHSSMTIGSDNKKLETEKIERLTKLVDTSLPALKIPGAIISISLPGHETWVYASGLADVSTGRKIQKEDRFKIASITKTFTSTVILQLMQEGKIGLDDKLSKYFTNLVPKSDSITIRYLLNHKSGVPNYYLDSLFYYHLIKDPGKIYTPYKLLDIANKYPFYYSPGDPTKWHYSNSNYIILGLLIEKLTGKKVQDVIKERVIDKIKLTNTFFPKTMDELHQALDNQVYGHEDFFEQKRVNRTFIDPSHAWSTGAMVSNVNDLRKYIEALVKGGLLNDEYQKKRMTEFIQGTGIEYGYGIARAHGALGHAGSLLGYDIEMYYMMAKDAYIIVMTNGWPDGNASVPASEIMIKALDILFPEGYEMKKDMNYIKVVPDFDEIM